MPVEDDETENLWLKITCANENDVKLDGSPEMYELLDMKRYAGSSSSQGEREWEKGLFLDEDRCVDMSAALMVFF